MNVLLVLKTTKCPSLMSCFVMFKLLLKEKSFLFKKDESRSVKTRIDKLSILYVIIIFVTDNY